MILVTGASGKTGRAVLASLARTGAATRTLVHRPDQTQRIVDLGAREVLVADLRLAADMRRAVQDVDSVYHICPNMMPDEVGIGRILLDAAKGAGVRRVVLHSVLHPQAEKMPHHWNKLRVEEAVIESGLDFTILRPAPYMQNLLAAWERITDQGLLRNPYPTGTRLSLVDLTDVAEIATAVLTEPGHSAATYELVGTAPLSQTEVAEILGRALGRSVRAEAEPVIEWEGRARSSGMSTDQRALLTAMFEYYSEYGLAGNPNTLRGLLGREPTTLAEFVRRTIEERAAREGGPRDP